MLEHGMTVDTSTHSYFNIATMRTSPYLRCFDPNDRWYIECDNEYINGHVYEGDKVAFFFKSLYGYSTEYVVNLGIYDETQEEIVVQTNICSGSAVGPDPVGNAVNYLPIYYPVQEMTIESNIPIFDSYSDAQTWIESDYTRNDLMLNYTGNIEEDGTDFEIINIWAHGTWTRGQAPIPENIAHRDVRGRIVGGGKISLYPIDGIIDGSLRYGIVKNGSFINLEYTLDGQTWISTDTFPFDFFYKERTNELGTLDYALTLSQTYIPIFSSHADAQDYIAGTKDITDAENWQDIALYYPEIVNGTGISDDTTSFGDVYQRSIFSQQYICSESVIQQIANGLYDTSVGGIFENIKKGVEMFGANPIESVLSLVYYPMDLTSVFTNISSQSYVYFGGYKFDLTGASVGKIIYPNGHKDLGTFLLKPTFKNYRDYEPYTKLRVYLPYIGWQQLDVKRYIGKSVKVRYYIDTRTNGSCVACLIANGLLTDYFTGQMGVSMPMTLTDFSAYANSQIQTILSGGNSTAGNISDVAKGVGTLAQGGSLGGAGMAGMIGAEVGAVASISKTVYSLGSNNINNYNATKGTCSSMINMYLPQEVMFEFEIQDLDDTYNAVELRGYPSNASGTLNNFSGYFEAQEVKLICSGATESEKSEIIQLLNSGVYI